MFDMKTWGKSLRILQKSVPTYTSFTSFAGCPKNEAKSIQQAIEDIKSELKKGKFKKPEFFKTHPSDALYSLLNAFRLIFGHPVNEVNEDFV